VRWLLIIIVTCLALTALKFAVIALAIALLISVLWGAFAHPAEAFGTLAFFLFANVLVNHTVACLALAGCIGCCFIVRQPRSNARGGESEVADCGNE
jgi:hypothetical protein